MNRAILVYLKGFDEQYRGEITTFFNTAFSEIAIFDPQFVGTDYTTLVTAINAIPGNDIPASVAEELSMIQFEATSALTAAIQTTINRVLNDLLQRVESMCLSELIDLINSNLFTSQITSAFIQASSEIVPAANAMLAKQLALMQSLGLTAAAMTLANTTLQTNSTAMVTFYQTAVTLLQTQIMALLTALLATLAALLTTGITGFQNVAISQINTIVDAFFGMTSVPPIPLV